MNTDLTIQSSDIQVNWRNLKQLQKFVGLPYHGSLSFNWGDVPTEKASIDIDDDGNISRIRTYSGMRWNAQSGYGTPVCDTNQ